MNIQKYLSNHKVPFDTLDHEPTYSAQTLARAVHVSGKEVAKSVLIRVDDTYVLVVLPATRSVDLTKVRRVLGAEMAELATEGDCGHLFVDCEFGARLPFGSQYGMKTLMDETLLADDEIVFEGNTHQEAIRMQLKDYRRLEEPLVAPCSHPF